MFGFRRHLQCLKGVSRSIVLITNTFFMHHEHGQDVTWEEPGVGEVGDLWAGALYQWGSWSCCYLLHSRETHHIQGCTGDSLSCSWSREGCQSILLLMSWERWLRSAGRSRLPLQYCTESLATALPCDVSLLNCWRRTRWMRTPDWNKTVENWFWFLSLLEMLKSKSNLKLLIFKAKISIFQMCYFCWNSWTVNNHKIYPLNFCHCCLLPEEHERWDTIQHDLNIEQYLGSTSFCEAVLTVWFIHAVWTYINH